MHALTLPIAPPAASTCPTCITTAARKGMGVVYVDGCDSCSARGIARSAVAFHAKAEPGALDDVVRRVFPKAAPAEALGWVRYWWRVDHPVTS